MIFTKCFFKHGKIPLGMHGTVNMGSILENVFAQELVSNGFLLRYFNKKNIGGIDFIVQKGKSAVPIEIKSGNDYTKHKALDNLIAKQRLSNTLCFVVRT